MPTSHLRIRPAFSTLGRVEVIATVHPCGGVRRAARFQYSRTSRGDCNRLRFAGLDFLLKAFSTLGRVEVIATEPLRGLKVPNGLPFSTLGRVEVIATSTSIRFSSAHSIFQYSRTSRGDCNVTTVADVRELPLSLSVLSDESR